MSDEDPDTLPNRSGSLRGAMLYLGPVLKAQMLTSWH